MALPGFLQGLASGASSLVNKAKTLVQDQAAKLNITAKDLRPSNLLSLPQTIIAKQIVPAAKVVKDVVVPVAKTVAPIAATAIKDKAKEMVKSEVARVKAGPAGVLKAPIQAAKAVPAAVQFAAQAIPGAAARAGVGAFLSTPVAQSLAKTKEPTYTPTGGVEKYFFGQEPIKSFQQQGREASQTLAALGAKEGAAKKVGLPAVLGLAALDVTGFGGPEKKLLKETGEALTEKAFKEAAERAVREVEPAIKKLVTGQPIKSVPLFRAIEASRGKVKQVAKDFTNPIVFEGDQIDLIRRLANANVKGAKEAIQPGPYPKVTDNFLDSYFKSKGYDAIVYKKTGAPGNVGPEIRDVATGGSLAVKPEAAALYSFGNAPAKAATATPPAATFKGFDDLSTKVLEKLKGRSTVSRQFIEDLTNGPDLKQPERELIRRLLPDEKEVKVEDFANRVKTELLPLEDWRSDRDFTFDNPLRNVGNYENITLPHEQRGEVKNYFESIYQSPIETKAGGVHYSTVDAPRYFAHSRIEDMADNKTRRVIEVQSDLFQKGRLEGEGKIGIDPTSHLPEKEQEEFKRLANRVFDINGAMNKSSFDGEIPELEKRLDVLREKAFKAQDAAEVARKDEVTKLEPYRNTWWERVIREENKKAAKDGKSTLQFPTGETAMKIEGLGDSTRWLDPSLRQGGGGVAPSATVDELKAGKTLINGDTNDRWVITEVLGDGKFKAVPQHVVEQDTSLMDLFQGPDDAIAEIKRVGRIEGSALSGSEVDDLQETFDISGKVDQSNPIFKFYEKDVGKYLTNKLGAKRVVDEQGVSWWNVPVKKEAADLPVEAFGFAAGMETDEEGNPTFDPVKGMLGFGAAGIAKNLKNSKALLNVEKLNLPPAERQKLLKTVEELRPELEAAVGKKLSNSEVVDAARTSEVLRRGVSRETTKKETSMILRTRQHLAKMAEKGEVTPEFIDTLRDLKSIATDRGRQLQALSIGADPEMNSVKTRMLAKIAETVDDTDKIVKAAKGVDFNNALEAAKFYRQFVKPTATEIINEYRYANLLSSPKTHIVNAFSNILQAAVVRPGTRLAAGAIDVVGSRLFGKQREFYASQVPAYYKGLVNSSGKAVSEAFDILRDKKFMTNLDMDRIPTLSPFTNGVRLVSQALEASDVFFRTLVEGGEKEALAARSLIQGIPVNEAKIAKEAGETAAYTVFRKAIDPKNKTEQGHLLSAIDKMTDAVQSAGDKAPVIRWFVPFVQTPMNILKQGVEHSPLGLLTLPGSKNKTEQLAKSVVGSFVFAGAGALAMQGRTTWALPENEKEKEAFYAAGLQPYSVDVGGGKWVKYDKLGPLAYPMAMAAAVKHYASEDPKAFNKTSQEKVAAVLGGIAQFFADQSYMQGIQNLVDVKNTVTETGGSGKTQLVSGLVGQMVPLASLQRWVTRMTDPVFRKPSSEFSVKGVVDNLIRDIPGLSTRAEPYRTPTGEESKRPLPLINALTPLTVSQGVPEYIKNLRSVRSEATLRNKYQAQSDKLKDEVVLTIQQKGDLDAVMAQVKEYNVAVEKDVMAAIEEGVLKFPDAKEARTFITRWQLGKTELNTALKKATVH